MKVFIPPAEPLDGSAYLAEILQAFGLCFTQRCPLAKATELANPNQDLILLPRGSRTDGIEAFLRAGGSVVTIQPDESLERQAGLSRKGQESAPHRLRLTQAVCHGARGEPLWTAGPIHVHEPKPGPDVIGYLYQPEDKTSETVGILESAVGDGRLVVYAYDPVLCIARLRQGHPDRANHLPPGQKTPRATFLHPPQPAADTFWRPTADLHARILCEIVVRLLSRRGPVPLLWHIPEGRPSILLFSGDEDGSQQTENEAQMRELESFGGGMNLYVIPDNTSITRERIEEYTRRGHAISVHPNLVPTAGQPVEVQLARAEEQVRMFQEKFLRPTHSVRNHYYMWPGYLDLPSLYERLGIGLDANTTATLYGSSLDAGPYVNVNAAVPLRFVREDGSLINVFQQPTHVNDDLAAHPTKDYSLKHSPAEFDRLAERLLDEAVRFFHAPVCANVHPCNYVKFSGPHARALMERTREFGLAIWSLDRWHDFWRARDSWRMAEHDWDGSRLRLVLRGTGCESLALLLPVRVGTLSLQSCRVNGVQTTAEVVHRFGRKTAQVLLPTGASEVAATVDYAA